MFKKNLSGIKISSHKHTYDTEVERMPSPSRVIITTAQHIGIPSVPSVKKGENVAIGQVVAAGDENGGMPVHSSISGTVKDIKNIQSADGSFCFGIEIENDFQNRTADFIVPKVESFEDLVTAAKQSGTVGLGGAGFPTWLKLSGGKNIDTVIINCAECEPYVTSDTKILLENGDYLKSGTLLLKKYSAAKNIYAAIEKSNVKGVLALKSIAKELPFLKIKELKSAYPQGSEKVLLYNILGRVIPEDKYPPDVGAIVINCSSLAALAKYILTGIPLTERIITVDGPAVKNKKTISVPIGTTAEEILNYCKIDINSVAKILFGGPMMGYCAESLESAIQKRHNAVIVLGEKDAKPQITTPCIRCGSCISFCPVLLDPVAIARAYEERDIPFLKKVKPNLCIECGCCSYVCPTNQPLVQRNKLAKALIYENIRS